MALPDCLATITAAAEGALAILYEVILVDNGSSDNTLALLRNWARLQKFNVVVIEELKPGLANARNAGFRQALGEIIACTDDDCHIAKDYFSSLQNAFSRHSGVLILGGRIELGDERDLPITIKLGDEIKELGPRTMPGGFIMGANLAMHRKIFDIVGPFDERFGAGAKFRSAEDTDYFVRARALGITVRYDPEPMVFHFHGRREFEDAKKLYSGYSFGDGALFAKHFIADASVRNHLISNLYWGLRDIFRRKSSLDPLLGRKNLFKLKWNFKGFLFFVRESIGSDK